MGSINDTITVVQNVTKLHLLKFCFVLNTELSSIKKIKYFLLHKICWYAKVFLANFFQSSNQIFVTKVHFPLPSLLESMQR